MSEEQGEGLGMGNHIYKCGHRVQPCYLSYDTLEDIMEGTNKECVWTFKDRYLGYKEDDSYYETDCNESFYFDDGHSRLKDYGNFKYCPYCGKEISDNWDLGIV
jgi:hypothetical protein